MGLLYHSSCVVKDVERAAEFYDTLLKTIGGQRIFDQSPLAVGYGRQGEGASFWLQSPEHFPFLEIASHCHFAFKVDTTDEVMAFCNTALDLGAEMVFDSREVDGMPGYLGFVFRDMDGHLPEIFAVT